MGGQGSVVCAIATTAMKHRVPTCIGAADLKAYFPAESVHSGESDFDPPRFKPDPSVYLKAIEWSKVAAQHSIALESSERGVASAVNANISLIIGYVGGSHIPQESRRRIAERLMAGNLATTHRGAALVIEDLRDLPPIVAHFAKSIAKGAESLGPWDHRDKQDHDPAELAALCGHGTVHLPY